MKTKSLAMFGLMVVIAAQVGQAANISVGYQNYNSVYNKATGAVLAPTSLVWFGAWNLDVADPSGLLNGYFAGTQSYAQLSSAFQVGATKLYQDFGDGSESYVFSMSDVGFLGRKVDMILWNASSAQTATQAAAFRWTSAAYPDGASLDTEVQVANVLASLDPEIAVSLLYGTAIDSGSDGLGYISTAGIPEPSTGSLLIGGIALVLANFRKSRNS
jgi:hypothetical protein